MQAQKKQLQAELEVERQKLSVINEKLESACGAVHVLFKRISCSADTFTTSLAFEDQVNNENLKVYLSLIEQRCMELISILKFIGLHQVSNNNVTDNTVVN